MDQPIPAPRRRRSDGERSRAAILREAMRLATVEGIGGLSIARLADAVGMSKSGLFAHFGSKLDLQLATVEAAGEVFGAQVVDPAAAETGRARLDRLVDGYLRYVESETFPGGCFFASVLAEVDTHPGPLRERLVAFLDDWVAMLEATIREAQGEGAIAASADAAQLAFEIESALFYANAQYVASRRHEPIERARRSIERSIACA